MYIIILLGMYFLTLDSIPAKNGYKEINREWYSLNIPENWESRNEPGSRHMINFPLKNKNNEITTFWREYFIIDRGTHLVTLAIICQDKKYIDLHVGPFSGIKSADNVEVISEGQVSLTNLTGHYIRISKFDDIPEEGELTGYHDNIFLIGEKYIFRILYMSYDKNVYDKHRDEMYKVLNTLKEK